MAAATPTKPVTIGMLSKRTGCNIETIRYYERIGLLPPPPRSPGGTRLYGVTQLKRLTFIRRSRELGFSLEEVRELLRLIDGGNYTCGEVLAIAAGHVRAIRQKIRDLRRLEKTLAAIAAHCQGGTVPDCPIIDALSSERSVNH